MILVIDAIVAVRKASRILITKGSAISVDIE